MNNVTSDLYKLIVDNSADVLYVLDFDERFVFISPSVEKIFGFTPEEVIGKKIHNFLTPQSYEKQRVNMLRALKEKKFDMSEKLILRVFRKDGVKIWAEVHAKFLFNKDGKVDGILGVVRDVTDRVQNEQDLI